MIQIVYASAATRPLTPDDLLRILRVSRRNNAAVGVTGALLHSDGNFMRVLEGPEDRVMETFHRIEKDPLHKGVLRLLRQTIEVRQFPEWSMGFRTLDGLDPEDQAGSQTLFDLTAPGPTRVQRMLHAFRLVPSDLPLKSRAAGDDLSPADAQWH